MKTLRLTRITTDQKGTFGALTIDGVPFCVTLEPPDNDNMRNISSIPASRYIIKRHYSPKYKQTCMVTGIPNRDFVLFHPGNIVNHTKGCIILAQHYGKLKGDRAVLNSANTFRVFKKLMRDEREAELIITESY